MATPEEKGRPGDRPAKRRWRRDERGILGMGGIFGMEVGWGWDGGGRRTGRGKTRMVGMAAGCFSLKRLAGDGSPHRKDDLELDGGWGGGQNGRRWQRKGWMKGMEP